MGGWTFDSDSNPVLLLKPLLTLSMSEDLFNHFRTDVNSVEYMYLQQRAS